MPTIRFDIKLPDNATADDVADAMARLKRDLEWLLNGNLDNKNVRYSVLTKTDSTAVTVAELRDDFNALLTELRTKHFIS